MKWIRILSALLLLSLCLGGCSIHQKVLPRSPVMHTVTKADVLGSITEDSYAPSDSDTFARELPIPLHILPRTLFQTATNEWVEYIPPIGMGVCYLFSYDAGEEIVSYVVMVDIISSGMMGSHAGMIEADGKQHTIYGTQQELQIGIGSNCAVKWNKKTDSLTVWANPPFRPEIKASLQMEKEEYEGDNVGTVLTEWSLNGRISTPIPSSETPTYFSNTITRITNWLFGDKEINAIEDLSYGIIKNAAKRGEISYWSDYTKQDHTNNERVPVVARDNFQNNYLYQSHAYGGTALGGVALTHSGQLKNESDYILLICHFTGTDPQIAQQIKWTIHITLTFGK